MRLEGKVVLITGASEGIGAACAAAFRRRGARLSLLARSADKLERVGGPDAVITAGDIREASVRERALESTVRRFGAVDVLINNVGVGLYAPAWRAPIGDVRHMFELNLFSMLEMTQLVLPGMRERKSGVIVNVSSIAGKLALPWFTLYSASKYAVCALTDGLRRELQHEGIHAMAVCPGYVRTGFQDHVLAGRPPESIRRSRRFAITAEQCAEAMVRGVERNSRTVVTPRAGWLLIAAERLFPSFMDGRLGAMYRNLERSE